MTEIAYIVIGIELVFMLVYLIFYYRFGSKTILGLKMATSFCFVILGLLLLHESSNAIYATTMMLGLGCGFVGDLVLGLRRVYRNRKKEFFYAGLLLFFLGHILYITAFFHFNNVSFWSMLLVSIILTITMSVVANKTQVAYGKAIIPVTAYMLVSSFVISLALLNFFKAYSFLSLVVFIGAFSFVLSDFLLSYLYFKKMRTKTIRFFKAINIITYYLGQTLFAISVLWV
jgi:uncharacterized membrane protein YhhN